MACIVDGDNLLGSWPGRRRSDPERRALAREVGRNALRERRRIVLVFDGPDPPVPLSGGEVLFAGTGRSADALILSFLKAQPERGGWTVVTNDRPLGDQCRWLGAHVERCDAFRGRLLDTEPDEKPASPGDVDYWLEVFGEEKGPSRKPPGQRT